MDLDTATQIAEKWLAQYEADSQLKLKLYRGETVEHDFGWVFFWGPEDESILVGGNAPIIVDRHSGSVHITGTAFPLEEYLESYARIRRTYPFALALQSGDRTLLLIRGAPPHRRERGGPITR